MYLTKNKAVRKILGIIETINFLSIKLLIKRRNNFRTFPGMVFRDYMSLAGKDKWVNKDIFDIIEISPGERIVIEHLAGEGIATPLDELAYMALISKTIQPKYIFEIGTFRGRTALNFSLNSPDDCTVYTLDLPYNGREEFSKETSVADTKIINASFTGKDFLGKDVEYKIKQLYGNSLNFDFSPYFGMIDIVFIDGAHHYKAVKSDTQNALKMVRSGGYIIWHDFANYGDYNDVTRAVLESLPNSEIIQIKNSQLAVYKKNK